MSLNENGIIIKRQNGTQVGYQKMPTNMACDMNFSLKDQVNQWVWGVTLITNFFCREKNVEQVISDKKKRLDQSNKFTVFEFRTSKSKSINNSAIHVQLKLKFREKKNKHLKYLIETA